MNSHITHTWPYHMRTYQVLAAATLGVVLAPVDKVVGQLALATHALLMSHTWLREAHMACATRHATTARDTRTEMSSVHMNCSLVSSSPRDCSNR